MKQISLVLLLVGFLLGSACVRNQSVGQQTQDQSPSDLVTFASPQVSDTSPENSLETTTSSRVLRNTYFEVSYPLNVRFSETISPGKLSLRLERNNVAATMQFSFVKEKNTPCHDQYDSALGFLKQYGSSSSVAAKILDKSGIRWYRSSSINVGMGSIDEDIVYEAQTSQGCYLQKLSMLYFDSASQNYPQEIYSKIDSERKSMTKLFENIVQNSKIVRPDQN